MKKVCFNMHKWSVRALVAIGALLGISACSHRVANPAEGVYGPPPGYVSPEINAIDDVYGPPVVRKDSVPQLPEKDQSKDDGIE